MRGSTPLALICTLRGVLGCALVEGKTGMVIEHHGSLLDMEQFGEMAVEFWRVHERLPKSFVGAFGALDTQLCMFEECVIALTPAICTEAAVVICIGSKGQVDWPALVRMLRSHR